MAKRRKVYRDKRGRFVSKVTWLRLAAAKARKPAPRRGRRFTREEEHLLDDIRRPLRGKLLPAGTEFELTATTRGETPKRRRR